MTMTKHSQINHQHTRYCDHDEFVYDHDTHRPFIEVFNYNSIQWVISTRLKESMTTFIYEYYANE